MSRFVLAALIVVALSLGGPLAPTAQAATTCTGILAPPGTTISGDVVVPSFSTCTIDGVTVTGNVTVQANAELEVVDHSTIKGNLTTTGGDRIAVADSTIKGKLTVSGVTDIGVGLNNATVGGAATLTDSRSITLRDSHFGGNLTVNDIFEAFLSNNQINGKLSCSGNNIEVGSGGNTAKGGKFGDCANI